MTVFQPVNEQLGYCFHPPTAEHRLGYPQLDVVIRPTPTGEHFDPESVTCLTATANGSGKLHVVHPWAQDNTYRVCAGEIDIEDARLEHVKAFTFGGDLRIDADARRTICQIISPVPLLEHARQSLSLEELFIEEVIILFRRSAAPYRTTMYLIANSRPPIRCNSITPASPRSTRSSCTFPIRR